MKYMHGTAALSASSSIRATAPLRVQQEVNMAAAMRKAASPQATRKVVTSRRRKMQAKRELIDTGSNDICVNGQMAQSIQWMQAAE